MVDASLQQKLYDLSPYNAIRLELTKDLPEDTENENRYTRAAASLKEWQHASVLQQDTLRNLYVLQQEFVVEGKIFTRRGFFARVRLEPFGQGKIYPHEETMSGPKADRLKLYRSTAMNISPVFGLYPDEANEVFANFENSLMRQLPLSATDHLGVTSKIWPITDEKIILAVTGQMTNRPIFIADGHHRYETGLKYRDELEANGMLTGPDHPANFILMNLVSMSDPGLIILPTHRLVSGLPGLSSKILSEKLQPHFEVKVLGKGTAAGREAWDEIEMDGSQDILGLYTKADDTWILARIQNPELMEKLASDHSEDWQELAVSVLHVLVLNHLLGGQGKCQYVHLLGEVEAAISDQQCDLAALVPPATMEHVESIAGHLEKRCLPNQPTFSRRYSLGSFSIR